MPTELADWIYICLSALLVVSVGAIGKVAWWGFSKLIGKLEEVQKTVAGLVTEMQLEREARKDQYHALERRVLRIETKCDLCDDTQFVK